MSDWKIYFDHAHGWQFPIWGSFITCLKYLFIIFQPRVLDDVNRKLQLFMEMWSAGQLSEHVKCRMCKMAEGTVQITHIILMDW